MKRLLFIGSVATLLLSGCGGGNNGQLTGVPGRIFWYQPDPYGMLYCPMGEYIMGPSDQEAPFAYTTKSKTVSIQAFYMDQTEITNNEYRQFVYWVRDSIAHRILADEISEDHIISVDAWDEDIDPPLINWRERIDWDDADVREALEPMYLPEHERFYRRREIDTRKLDFEYYWIDLRDAARKGAQGAPLRERGKNDRSEFIERETINVYPDTLCWIHDFTYSFNEPMTNMYFWHPAFDEYPVVGVTWKQARAFGVWRTQLYNSYLHSIGGIAVQDFRLPTESEWEYAARGGLDMSPYPWGGPYTRNSRGCFLANFKPLRGNYVDDGGFHTVRVASYSPNEWGLYDMAGNVAEWTSNAFDESAYDFAHDLNPDYQYNYWEHNADDENDPPALKRKVIRGGSWKDIGYYIQTGSRTYEYQDSAKSYIGFRQVMTYLGRSKDGEGGI